MYALELSGENVALAKAELEHCLRALGFHYEIVGSHGRLFLLDFQGDAVLLMGRLGLARSLYEVLHTGPERTILDDVKGISLPEGLSGSFAIGTKGLGTKFEEDMSSKIKDALGQEFLRPGLKVDLDDPEHYIEAVLANDTVMVGRLLTQVDRSEQDERKVQNRPFFSPISIHPKFCRALINLTGVGTGDGLLDPMCGTGGILIEGALMGMRCVGNDIKEDMVKGSKENLQYYGLDAELHIGDFTDLESKGLDVDCIVTDPPYGRASTTSGEDIEKLYGRFFRFCGSMLDKGQKLGLVLPGEEWFSLGGREFVLEEHYSIRIHRSLTRHLCLFTRL